MWQRKDTTKNIIGTKHNWTDVASTLGREQARIIIGVMETDHHPLINCLIDTMQVTVMKLEHNKHHKIMFLGQINRYIGDRNRGFDSDELVSDGTKGWPAIHTLRWSRCDTALSQCALGAFMLGGEDDKENDKDYNIGKSRGQL